MSMDFQLREFPDTPSTRERGERSRILSAIHVLAPDPNGARALFARHKRHRTASPNEPHTARLIERQRGFAQARKRSTTRIRKSNTGRDNARQRQCSRTRRSPTGDSCQATNSHAHALALAHAHAPASGGEGGRGGGDRDHCSACCTSSIALRILVRIEACVCARV